MKKLIIIFLLLPIIAAAQFKVPMHTPNSYVSDFDHILSSEQTATINQRLAAINKASSVEIAIVILSDLQGYDIDIAANEIFRTWGIGKKGLDNGLLYIVSPANRKGHIEVGNGLEGDLPDVVTKDLQVPAREYYKQGQYYEGILQVIDGITGKLKPLTQEQRANYVQKIQADKKDGFNWALIVITFGFISILIAVIVYVRNKTTKKLQVEKERLREEAERRRNLNDYKREYSQPSKKTTNIIAPIVYNNEPSASYTPPSRSYSDDSSYGSSSSSYDSGSSDSSSSFDFGGGSSSGGGSSDSW